MIAATWGRAIIGLAMCWLGLALCLTPATADDANSFAADGWIARCEAIACKASLASASSQEALLIARWAGTDGLSIGIATPRGIADRDRPIDVGIDGKVILTLQPNRDYAPLERVDTFWIVDSHTANTVVQAMQKGGHLRISYIDMVGAPHDADFALDALHKVTGFMDQAQHRPSPGGAMTGLAPPHSVASAPEMSRIDLIIRMGIPERLLIRHAHASDCEDPSSPRLKTIAPVIGPLSKQAILYAIPCLASGTEISYRLWIIETGEIGGITPLYFALYDPAFGWKGSDLLYNVVFDASGSKLTSQVKTLSGSCGHRATWHWKGYAFALDAFELASDCPAARGARIYPPK